MSDLESSITHCYDLLRNKRSGSLAVGEAEECAGKNLIAHQDHQ
jgi:hypothetical protein